MRNRLRILLLLAAIVLFAAAMLRPAPEIARKDKAAVLLYGGLLDEPILIARPDTANLFDIVFVHTRGDRVPAESLADRPCVGIAIFTTTEWHVLTAGGLPDEVPPERALTRVRLYPAIGDEPAAVQGAGILAGKTAWTVIPQAKNFVSSLPLRVEPGTGATCDVEV